MQERTPLKDLVFLRNYQIDPQTGKLSLRAETVDPRTGALIEMVEDEATGELYPKEELDRAIQARRSYQIRLVARMALQKDKIPEMLMGYYIKNRREIKRHQSKLIYQQKSSPRK